MSSTYRLLLRSVATFLLCAITSQEVSWAAAEVMPDIMKFSSNPFSFSIPASVAQKSQPFISADSDKSLILIQDAHVNESAQRNIAKILDIVSKKNKTTTVFLEAGTGNDSLSYLRQFASLKKRKEVAEIFLKKGLVQGADYFDLVSDKPVQLWGVEDKKLYREGLAIYALMKKTRPEIFAFVGSLERAADTLSPKVLNPPLHDLLVIQNQSDTGKEGLATYVSAIFSEARKEGLDSSAFPTLTKLEELRKKEALIDFSKAAQEQMEAMSRLPAADRQELADAMLSLRKGPWNEEKNGVQRTFYSQLQEKVKNLARYPELQKSIDYVLSFSSVKSSDIFSEKEALEKLVMESLAKTDEERRFIEALERIRKFKKLFALELTADEFRAMKNSNATRPEQVAGYLNRLLMEKGCNAESYVFWSEKIGVAYYEGLRFYELTLARDEAFLKNAFKRMDEKGQKSAVLITGGFHVEHLAELLRQRGISHVVVTPGVLQETDKNKYENLLLKKSAWAVLPAAEMRVGTLPVRSNLGTQMGRRSRTVVGNDPNGARLAESNALFRNLILSINLMDLNPHEENGIIGYRDSLKKLRELLPTIARLGVGKLYVYGGLYEPSELSKKVHTVEHDGEHFIEGGNAMIRVTNYTTSRMEVSNGLKPLTDRNGNSFSIASMEKLNPKLSGDDEDRVNAEFAQITSEAKALGIEIVADFIPWTSPDAINESNYKRFFYREIQNNSDTSPEAMKSLLREHGGWFPVRITENDKTRLILVRHVGGSNVDQAMPNPMHPDTRAYYKRVFRKFIDYGVTNFRIDLGHYLLKKNARGDFIEDLQNHHGVDLRQWVKDSGHDIRDDESFDDWWVRQRDLWEEVLEDAYAYAQSKELNIGSMIFESYGPADQNEIHRTNPGAIYFSNLFDTVKSYIDQPNSQADWFNPVIDEAFTLGEYAATFPSNFDQNSLAKLIRLHGREPLLKDSFTGISALFAALGVQTIVDLREFMGYEGQINKIVGGDRNQYDRSHHPFPTVEEVQYRLNQPITPERLENSPMARVLRTLRVLKGAGPFIEYRVLDNSHKGRFLTVALKNELEDWYVVLIDLKPRSSAEDSEARKAGIVQISTSGTKGLNLPWPVKGNYELAGDDSTGSATLKCSHWIGSPDHPDKQTIDVPFDWNNVDRRITKVVRLKALPAVRKIQPPKETFSKEAVLAGITQEKVYKRLQFTRKSLLLDKRFDPAIAQEGLLFTLLDPHYWVRAFVANALARRADSYLGGRSLKLQLSAETINQHLMDPLISIEQDFPDATPTMPYGQILDKTHARRNKRYALIWILAHLLYEKGTTTEGVAYREKLRLDVQKMLEMQAKAFTPARRSQLDAILTHGDRPKALAMGLGTSERLNLYETLYLVSERHRLVGNSTETFYWLNDRKNEILSSVFPDDPLTRLMAARLASSQIVSNAWYEGDIFKSQSVLDETILLVKEINALMGQMEGYVSSLTSAKFQGLVDRWKDASIDPIAHSSELVVLSDEISSFLNQKYKESVDGAYAAHYIRIGKAELDKTTAGLEELGKNPMLSSRGTQKMRFIGKNVEQISSKNQALRSKISSFHSAVDLPVFYLRNRLYDANSPLVRRMRLGLPELRNKILGLPKNKKPVEDIAREKLFDYIDRIIKDSMKSGGLDIRPAARKPVISSILALLWEDFIRELTVYQSLESRLNTTHRLLRGVESASSGRINSRDRGNVLGLLREIELARSGSTATEDLSKAYARELDLLIRENLFFIFGDAADHEEDLKILLDCLKKDTSYEAKPKIITTYTRIVWRLFCREQDLEKSGALLGKLPFDRALDRIRDLAVAVDEISDTRQRSAFRAVMGALWQYLTAHRAHFEGHYEAAFMTSTNAFVQETMSFLHAFKWMRPTDYDNLEVPEHRLSKSERDVYQRLRESASIHIVRETHNPFFEPLIRSKKLSEKPVRTFVASEAISGARLAFLRELESYLRKGDFQDSRVRPFEAAEFEMPVLKGGVIHFGDGAMIHASTLKENDVVKIKTFFLREPPVGHRPQWVIQVQRGNNEIHTYRMTKEGSRFQSWDLSQRGYFTSYAKYIYDHPKLQDKSGLRPFWGKSIHGTLDQVEPRADFGVYRASNGSEKRLRPKLDQFAGGEYHLIEVLTDEGQWEFDLYARKGAKDPWYKATYVINQDGTLTHKSDVHYKVQSRWVEVPDFLSDDMGSAAEDHAMYSAAVSELVRILQSTEAMDLVRAQARKYYPRDPNKVEEASLYVWETWWGVTSTTVLQLQNSRDSGITKQPINPYELRVVRSYKPDLLNPRQYLNVLAHRELVDYWRGADGSKKSKATRSMTHKDSDGEDVLDEPVTRELRPDLLVEARESTIVTQLLTASLDSETARAWSLHASGMNMRDIAETLEISLSTVHKRVKAAKEVLSEGLDAKNSYVIALRSLLSTLSEEKKISVAQHEAALALLYGRGIQEAARILHVNVNTQRENLNKDISDQLLIPLKEAMKDHVLATGLLSENPDQYWELFKKIAERNHKAVRKAKSYATGARLAGNFYFSDEIKDIIRANYQLIDAWSYNAFRERSFIDGQTIKTRFYALLDEDGRLSEASSAILDKSRVKYGAVQIEQCCYIDSGATVFSIVDRISSSTLTAALSSQTGFFSDGIEIILKETLGDLNFDRLTYYSKLSNPLSREPVIDLPSKSPEAPAFASPLVSIQPILQKNKLVVPMNEELNALVERYLRAEHPPQDVQEFGQAVHYLRDYFGVHRFPTHNDGMQTMRDYASHFERYVRYVLAYENAFSLEEPGLEQWKQYEGQVRQSLASLNEFTQHVDQEIEFEHGRDSRDTRELDDLQKRFLRLAASTSVVLERIDHSIAIIESRTAKPRKAKLKIMYWILKDLLKAEDLLVSLRPAYSEDELVSSVAKKLGDFRDAMILLKNDYEAERKTIAEVESEVYDLLEQYDFDGWIDLFSKRYELARSLDQRLVSGPSESSFQFNGHGLVGPTGALTRARRHLNVFMSRSRSAGEDVGGARLAHTIDQLKTLRQYLDEHGQKNRPIIVWDVGNESQSQALFTAELKRKMKIRVPRDEDFEALNSGGAKADEMTRSARFILINHELSQDRSDEMNDLDAAKIFLATAWPSRAVMVVLDRNQDALSPAQEFIRDEFRSTTRPFEVTDELLSKRKHQILLLTLNDKKPSTDQAATEIAEPVNDTVVKLDKPKKKKKTKRKEKVENVTAVESLKLRSASDVISEIDRIMDRPQGEARLIVVPSASKPTTTLRFLDKKEDLISGRALLVRIASEQNQPIVFARHIDDKEPLMLQGVQALRVLERIQMISPDNYEDKKSKVKKTLEALEQEKTKYKDFIQSLLSQSKKTAFYPQEWVEFVKLHDLRLKKLTWELWKQRESELGKEIPISTTELKTDFFNVRIIKNGVAGLFIQGHDDPIITVDYHEYQAVIKKIDEDQDSDRVNVALLLSLAQMNALTELGEVSESSVARAVEIPASFFFSKMTDVRERDAQISLLLTQIRSLRQNKRYRRGQFYISGIEASSREAEQIREMAEDAAWLHFGSASDFKGVVTTLVDSQADMKQAPARENHRIYIPIDGVVSDALLGWTRVFILSDALADVIGHRLSEGASAEDIPDAVLQFYNRHCQTSIGSKSTFWELISGEKPQYFSTYGFYLPLTKLPVNQLLLAAARMAKSLSSSA